MRHGNLSVSTEEIDIRDFLVTTPRIFTKSVFEKWFFSIMVLVMSPIDLPCFDK